MRRPAAGRYQALDSLRGFLLVNMVAYHALYDVVYILGIPLPWYTGLGGYIWQQGICWGFILLSGFCFRLSHHPVRHGLTVLGAGVLVSAVTWVAMPGEFILFGVLYLLGLAGLIQCGAWALWGRLGRPPFPAGWGLGLALGAFFLTRDVPKGWLGFEGLRLLPLPGWLYQDWLAVVGLPGPGFASSDYFPLVPWLFLYLAGYYLWRLMGHRPRLMDRLKPGFAPLAFIGRHSLPVYLLHQPVLMAGFALALGWGH
ncbi:heparan-alpha-glucosaminide N-acetyltransferase [Acutalibacter caecimuris]|uniref:heparan-alpha-glucosaminide N-acetyltransferase n=1 Tax=Acutalibacter caecimuris TaxID=3093657 RepID=UPI002AC90E65|nr:heparan-alpha-glucosaminide N-acetyltransferase [Acutalibacter sp. M00118]